MADLGDGLEMLSIAEILAESPDTWLIPNRIASSVTVFSGQPKAGKSRLSLNLAVALLTGAPFLGAQPLRTIRRVLFLKTDGGDPQDTAKQLRDAIDDPIVERNAPIIRGVSTLNLDAALAVAGHGDVIILDNLTGLVDDINEQSATAPVMRKLGRVADSGVPVVVIAHAAKPYQGRATSMPMGSQAIYAGTRHVVTVEKKRDESIHVTCRGNHMRGIDEHLCDWGDTVADLTIQGGANGEAKVQRSRDQRGVDRDEQIAWYRDNVEASLPKSRRAELMAGQFGGKPATWERHLAASRWLAEALANTGGDGVMG